MVRKSIKQYIKALILNKTSAGDRVYTQRYLPLDKADDFPAVCIYFIIEEVSEKDNLNQERKLHLAIECVVDSENYDEEVDDLSDQVENAILQHTTEYELGIKLVKIEPGYDEDAKSHVMAARLLYEVMYYKEAVASSPDIDLTSIGVKYDINGNEIPDEVNYE